MNGENTKIWTCKIGPVHKDLLPDSADAPMRAAARAAFVDLTGREPDFIFTGWGGELTEEEEEVIRRCDAESMNDCASPAAPPEFAKGDHVVVDVGQPSLMPLDSYVLTGRIIDGADGKIERIQVQKLSGGLINLSPAIWISIDKVRKVRDL